MKKFADQVIILGEDNRILADGPPQEALKNYNFLAMTFLLDNYLQGTTSI